MINFREGGITLVECDKCDAVMEYHVYGWGELIKKLTADGWKINPEKGGYWVHRCLNC